MSPIKRVLSFVLALVTVFAACTATAFAAPKAMVSLEIKTMPDKLKFYRGTDWDYGIWDLPEDDADNVWLWQAVGSDISFLHNQGSGNYPERGMIDLTGLVIEIKYSDGSTKTLRYKETPIAENVIKPNILAAPRKDFCVGKNVIEIYVEEDIRFYDTYEIEIIDSPAPPVRAQGDVNGDGRVNSTDAYMLLRHSVGERFLSEQEQEYADLNGDKKFNSTDALIILRIAVGMA